MTNMRRRGKRWPYAVLGGVDDLYNPFFRKNSQALLTEPAMERFQQVVLVLPVGISGGTKAVDADEYGNLAAQAYIFTKTASGWRQMAQLKGSGVVPRRFRHLRSSLGDDVVGATPMTWATWSKAESEGRYLLVVNVLLQEVIDGDQGAVLNIIHGYFEESSSWPIWQYVDLQVKPYGAAGAALANMPRLVDTTTPTGLSYGWTWSESRFSTPPAGTKIELTVSGLWALRFDELPRAYVELLRLCGRLQAELVPSATEVQSVTIDRKLLTGVLLAAARRHLDEAVIEKRLIQLQLLARREPPTMGHADLIEGAWWQLRVPPDITDYADVESVEDYLSRLTQSIEPMPVPFAR